MIDYQDPTSFYCSNHFNAVFKFMWTPGREVYSEFYQISSFVPCYKTQYYAYIYRVKITGF